MGRGRKKRMAKRRIKQKQRREIRMKMGKPVFFNLTRCNKPIPISSDRYNYKANMHKLRIIKGSVITNVKYQASIITNCYFGNVHLNGIDFFNTNLRDTSFCNAALTDVVFFDCNLSGVDFTGAKLTNVVFMSANIRNTKGLVLNDTCKIYATYPKLQIEEMLKNSLLSLANDMRIFRYRVLHVNKNKLNFWSLNVLLDTFGDDMYRALSALPQYRNRQHFFTHFFTLYSYKKYIEIFLQT